MPRRNPLFGSGPDPETRFDHWLDGFVTGTSVDDASRHDDPTGQLARAQSGARQLHDLAARPVTMSGTLPARQRIEERMMQSGTLAAPGTSTGGTSWKPPRQQRGAVPWWSLNSPVIATALVIAVLVSLSGALYWVQRPPATPEPTESPGFSQSSPNATPEGGDLSCSAPGYRPVVMGDVAADDLAMIGETQEPIVLGDDETTIPLPDGSTTTLHGNSYPMRDVPGAYISFDPATGDRTVTNTLIDQTWEFPALDLEGVMHDAAPGTFAFVEAGPYVIGTTDSQGFDWRIVDVRTGDSVTTSDLLGGTFPWMVIPDAAGTDELDTDIQAIQFSHAVTSISGITTERTAPVEAGMTKRALHDDLAVVLPGTVQEAELVDLGDLLGENSWGGSTTFVVSNDESHIAWRGWSENETGESSFTFFVAAVDDLANAKPTMRFDDPWGNDPLAFSPDNSVLYILTGNSIQAVQANPLESKGVEQISVIGQDPLNILSINNEAGTIIYAGDGGSGPETWMLDTATGETNRLPELDGFGRYSPIDESGQHVIASSQAADGLPVNGASAEYIVVDTATGNIIHQVPFTISRAADGGPNRSLNFAAIGNGFVLYIDRSSDDGEVRVVDARTGEQWKQALPKGVDNRDANFTISPSGECLLLHNNVDDQDAPVTDSYIAPLEPDARWTKLDVPVTGWWKAPIGANTEIETLPAQDFAPPVASPDAFEPDFHTRPDVNIILFAQPAPTGIGSLLPLDAPLMALDDPEAPGTPFTQTDHKGQIWVNVRTEDGRTGWVREVDLVPIDQDMGPEQESSSPEAPPTSSAVLQIIPDNLMPVFGPGPIDELPDPQTGGFSEAGLILPLRNGETLHDQNGVGISQVGHTNIAIVEHAVGSRISIDLDTGETLASLYPKTEQELLIGTYQLRPANDEMTNWRIVDLRTGEQVTTSDLFGGAFDQPAIPLLIALDLDHPETMMVRFVEPEQRAGELQAVTPPSGQSSTVIIPGTLADAHVTELNYGRPFGEPQSVALHTQGDSTRMAYVADVPSEVIRIADATSGETIQTFSATDIEADGQVSIAGFFDDGNSLIAWSGSTISLLNIDDGSAQTVTVGTGAIAQVFPGASSALVMTNPSAGTPIAQGVRSWHHLDLESGDWTNLPELDGYYLDRALPTTPWMVLRGGTAGFSTVIVDRRTGEIAARLDEPDVGTATALSPAHDFSVIVITGHTGDESSTGYVLDANRGEAWEITSPDTGNTMPTSISYRVSPDGSLLIATSRSLQARNEGEALETWISPIQPDPEWISIGPRSIETWLYDPEENP